MAARVLLPIREGALGFVAAVTPASAPFTAHSHDELELNLVTRGQGLYLVGEERVRLTRHCLLLLEPGAEHLLFDRSPDFRMWVVVLQLSPNRRLPPSTKQSPHAVVKAGTARAMSAVCEQLADVGSLLLLNAGLTYLQETALAELADTTTGCPTLNVHPAVAATARRIKERPELELQALADAARMSPGRLGRLFKGQMGVPLSTYRNRLRLDSARERLQNTDVSTLEAALASGFGSYAQFYRVFREETGLSPRHGLARRQR